MIVPDVKCTFSLNYSFVYLHTVIQYIIRFSVFIYKLKAQIVCFFFFGVRFTITEN